MVGQFTPGLAAKFSGLQSAAEDQQRKDMEKAQAMAAYQKTQLEPYGNRNVGAFDEAFGKIAAQGTQTEAEKQMWQGVAQQQQLARAQAGRRGFSATGARAAEQAGAELQSVGYGQAAQIRAAEEARRRQLQLGLAAEQTKAAFGEQELASQRLQDTLQQEMFKEAQAQALVAAQEEASANMASGILGSIPVIGSLVSQLARPAKTSDENLKKNITDGSAEADARLDALSGTLPLPEDADIRGGSYYKQTGPIMTVYTPRPGAVFEAKSAKQQTTRNEAMPKNDYAEANEFYDTLIDEQAPRRALGSYPTRVAAVASPVAMRSIAPGMERTIPVEMTRARPMQVVTAGPSLEPDYEALAAAVQRGRENPQVEAGLRAARGVLDLEAELMQRAREQQRARLLGREVALAPETITARAPMEAARSVARSPRVADQALNALTPLQFKYREEALAAGEPAGRQLGVTTQNMAKSPALRSAVVETPVGQAIDMGDAMYQTLPMIGRLNERLRKVEGKKAPAKSAPTREVPRMIQFSREALRGGEY